MNEYIRRLAWDLSGDPADESEVKGDMWVFTESEMEKFSHQLINETIKIFMEGCILNDLMYEYNMKKIYRIKDYFGIKS